MGESLKEQIEALYRTESRRILATLIRLLGDFDLAEDALHDAFKAALEHWPKDGVPGNPTAWLISAGRFKGIDQPGRRARFEAPLDAFADRSDVPARSPEESDPTRVKDDRLRLIFICSHPALAPEARVALTLREVCGLTTEEIARAFLPTPSTLAQRTVRA